MKDQDIPKHACHCGRTFIRKEHLRRHQATHGQPSFVCQVCKRSFTRNDLLRRHATLHDEHITPEPRRSKACDACHESKVRCGGGATCPLCEKRGIQCTYTRGHSANQHDKLPRPRELGSPNRTALNSVQISSDEDEVISDDSQDPSQHRYTKSDAKYGLTTMLNLMTQNAALTMINADLPAELLRVEAWYEQCNEIYLDRFHDHWPVVHAPSWRGMDHTIRSETCIAMIAMWSDCEDDVDIRELSLKIHDCFMKKLMAELLNVVDEGMNPMEWPFESWKLAICNVVFGLNSGRHGLISRAQRCFSLLVDDCREKDIFSNRNIGRHQESQYPGSYHAWRFLICERYVCLILAMFKVDAYFSLLTGHAPLIHRDELNISLPTSFTIWNAHGLDKYFTRLPNEPPDRKLYTVSQLIRSPVGALSPTILFEDVQLCLSEIAQGAWQYVQLRGMDEGTRGTDDSAQAADLLARLRGLREELDKLARLVDNPVQGIATGREYLIWAYATKENVEEAEGKVNVLMRIQSLRLSTMMLFHLIHMRIYADVGALFDRLPGTDGTTNGRVIPDITNDEKIATWTRSRDGRSALLHAVAALGVSEKVSGCRPKLSCEPIFNITLTIASLIIHACLTCVRMDEQARRSHFPAAMIADQPLLELNVCSLSSKMVPDPTLEWWLAEGNGTPCVGGVALDGERAAVWFGRLIVCLKDIRKTWPLSKKVMNVIEH